MNSATLIFSAAVTLLTGSGGPSSPANSHSTSFNETFADCVVGLKANQARHFVIGQGSAPLPESCLQGKWSQASFLESTYRYMLARSLLLRDYSSGVPADISKVGEVGSAPLSSRDKRDSDAPKRLALADCVARRAPVQSYALAQSEAGESSAVAPLTGLASALSVCSTNVSVRYPRGFQMQEAIVTRLYQLAYAARKPRDA